MAHSADDVRCRGWYNFDLQCERATAHDGVHHAIYMGPPPAFAPTLMEWDDNAQ